MTQQNRLMKPNIVWFDIPATDLARAMRFYSAVLGRELKEENFGEVPTADGGQHGCVVVKDFKPSADGIMIYFDVNGRLKEAVAAVQANGGTVQTDVHSIGEYGFRAEVLDSEGNCIALHAETEGACPASLTSVPHVICGFSTSLRPPRAPTALRQTMPHQRRWNEARLAASELDPARPSPLSSPSIPPCPPRAR